MYKPPIRGKTIKKKTQEASSPLGELESLFSLVEELKGIKKDIQESCEGKINEVDIHLKTLNTSINELVDIFENKLDKVSFEIQHEAIEVINKIKKGEDGKDGSDGKSINEEEVIKKILLQIPKIDEKSVTKNVLSLVREKLPKNQNNLLKIIQEKVEFDPMSVIEKIMELPEEQLSRLKLKSSNISGLDQTISAFNNQLRRGYLHGSGISNITGLIQAGTSISITGSGTSSSPYVINAVGGSSSVFVNGVEVTDPDFIDSNTLEFEVTGSDVSANVKGVNRVVVSGNTTATLGTYYISVATATYTDPTPAEGEGFTVLVRNGTATIGGTAYATAGTLVYRYYHSGAWANYVYITPASTSEINTGTEQYKAVTPDSLAGSYAGTKALVFTLLQSNVAVTVIDGIARWSFTIPPSMNGMNIVDVGVNVRTPSSSGKPTFQVSRGRQSTPTTDYSFVDVLSTKLEIDVSEYDSKDAATQAVIDTSNDDLLTGDIIRLDCDITGTGTLGLTFRLEARLP